MGTVRVYGCRLSVVIGIIRLVCLRVIWFVVFRFGLGRFVGVYYRIRKLSIL